MASIDETLYAVEKHLEENPDDASAWNAKGVLLAKKTEFGEALRCFDQAIRLNPELSEVYTNRGRVLLELGPDKANKALKAFEKALALSPDNPEALVDKAKALNVLGRTKDELLCYRKVSATLTEVPAVWVRMGDIELELGHFGEAVSSYDRALALDPEKAITHVHRAIALSMLEDWKEAVKSAERATKIAPDDIETWRVLADVNLRYGKSKSGMKALKRAAEIDPHDASVENTMGMVEYRDGHLKEATRHFKRALVRDKKHKSALKNLGFILMEQEEWSEAASIWDRLTALVKDDPKIYDAQATNYARLDDFCSASLAWSRARKLYKQQGNDREAKRVSDLGRAARINCSRQKKAAKAEKEHEKATRTFDDRFEQRRKKSGKRH